ncbi:hypothetical protein BJV78DRAFT_583862 [Lactifluus subvellereus]|nr:hypothetical protein BJV78DRAFT_583862 [Lactifluus subvellereus]
MALVEEGGLGYRAVVVNSRGCACVPWTSPQFYGLRTTLCRQAILYIAEKYPCAPLLGLRFSLGANFLARYVAEGGEPCRLVQRMRLPAYAQTAFTVNTHASPKRSLPPWRSRARQCSNSTRSSPFTLVAPPHRSPSRTCMRTTRTHQATTSSTRSAYLSSHSMTTRSLHGHHRATMATSGSLSGWFQLGEVADRWPRRPVLVWFRATAEDVDTERCDRLRGGMAGWWRSERSTLV